MQINFTGLNLEVTPALKTYTNEKFQRLDRHHDNIHSIHVTFHIENINHVAEANMHVDGVDMHAKAESNDMYSAVDLLVDKLTTQLTKHKEKQTDHR